MSEQILRLEDEGGIVLDDEPKGRSVNTIVSDIENVADALIMPFVNSDNEILLDGYFTIDELIKLGKLAEEFKEKTK